MKLEVLCANDKMAAGARHFPAYLSVQATLCILKAYVTREQVMDVMICESFNRLNLQMSCKMV